MTTEELTDSMISEDKIMQYIAEYHKHGLGFTNLTIYEYIVLREGRINNKETK